MFDSMAMTEMKMEAVLGGYSAYCNIWNELKDREIYFIMYGNGKTCFYGMTATGIQTHVLDSEVVIRNTEYLGADQFAVEVSNAMVKKSKKRLETYNLVNSDQKARVLWAFTVIRLQGFQDRLYDDCFENGDGGVVKRAVEHLDRLYASSKPSSWTMGLAAKALNATSNNQLALCI